MKKFSKESMQNFMLMHAEKLILGGCLAATGLFVWMSMGGENEVKDTPSGLLKQAQQAQVYVDKEAWAGPDGLQSFRKGEAAARDKIANAKRVDPRKYELSLMGAVCSSLAPRQDPEIFGPEQLIATQFTVGVLMEHPDFRSPLEDFSPAPVRLEDGDAGFEGFRGGDDDYGAGGGSGSGSGSRTGLPEEYPTLPRSSTFNQVNAYTVKGLRPQAFGLSPDRVTTSVMDVVCVTAVVDFQKQTAAFEQAFADSIAYNAKRDRPVYQFLQVQRREVSGGDNAWEDISEKVIYRYPQRCPTSLAKMPLQMHTSAPEVVAPENYDPIISGVIPAFVMMDYQKIATHPALKHRREFPAWEPPKEKKLMDKKNGIFEEDDDLEDEYNSRGGPGDESGINGLRNGSSTELYREAIAKRLPGGQYRLVRFFDLEPPTNKSFEYRTRVWIGDPNQDDPNDGFAKNRGRRLEFDRDGAAGGMGDGGVKFAGGGSGMETDMDMGMDDFEDEDMDMKGPEVIQDILKTMLAPEARKRTAAASDLEMMNERLEKAARSDKVMEPFYVAEYSKTGELEQIKLPPSPRKYAYMQYLRFARPSAWSDSVRVESKRPTADVYAGPTIQGRSISMNSSAGKVEFDLVEPKLEVVVSSWVRNLGTKLPSRRAVYVGETLNFNAPAYVTHPISWEVLAGENSGIKDDEDIRKYILPIRSGTTVVDMFAGKTMEVPNNKKLVMEMPTELLTMDANGDLSVSNQFDAATDYRNAITEKDSSRFYGRPRRPKKEKDEYDEGDDYGDDY